MKILTAAFAAVLAVLPAATWAGTDVHVVDGDTIDVDGVRYRLHGIDAPEAGQKCKSASGKEWKCGQAAIKEIEGLVAGRNVFCDDRGTDDYNRKIGVCRVDGRDINVLMVETGMAWAFRQYSFDYVPLENTAKSKKIGIWQADTQPAWEYRADKWKVALQMSPPGCPIKGNINSKKIKIYHTPWSRDYPKTKVSVEKGERWFCSEREALYAGWRAPLWGK